MSMAFYALSGGCIYRNKDGEQFVLQSDAIAWLAETEPEKLLPLQNAVLQSLGRANGIAKAVTCIQALWFCSQCIARLSEDLAISLLELNTFAHCVSTLLIYVFWWDKPYEVESYVLIESPVLGMATLFDINGPNIHLTAKRPDTNCRTIRNESPAPKHGHCLVKDESGNVLARVLHFVPDSRNLSLDSGLLLQSLEDGTLQIPGTGFHLAFEIDVGRDWEFHMERDESRRWEKMWRTWADLGFPVPSRPFPKSLDYPWRESRSYNLDSDIFSLITTADQNNWIPLIMALIFCAYGGLHLLAWQYNFRSKAENILWKTASIMTASTGVILLAMILGEELKWNYIFGNVRSDSHRARVRFWRRPRYMIRVVGICLKMVAVLIALVNIVARAFLIVESLKALPNSPPSTYVVPNWAAYFPHI